MAQLLDIQKVVIGPATFTATVRVAEGAPLNTSENVEATARVYWLMPEIADHMCLGDGGEKFQDVMGATPLVHLMEHVALELLARTNMAGDLSNARTRATEVERVYEIELACPDDVLVASALSSAGWIIQWAFGSADEDSKPNVDAIVAGIVNLTANSYSMEGNEAPMPGTAQAETEAEIADAAEGDEALEENDEAPELAEAAEVAEEGEEDAELEAKLAAAAEGEAEPEVDALAGLDVVVGREPSLDEQARALVDEIKVQAPLTLGDEVGFMDAQLIDNSEDPLA